MDAVERHALEPDASFDGGDLDCGNGLLLLIRQHIDPLARGQLLEFRSTEISVDEDFPAWCRMTGNELVSLDAARAGAELPGLQGRARRAGRACAAARRRASVRRAARSPSAIPDAAARRPRRRRRSRRSPSWASAAGRGRAGCSRPSTRTCEGRLADAEFEATADDASRLAVAAQLRAGVDVVTDGEQRRDNYASFVGGRLDNCQLIPLTDLLPLSTIPRSSRPSCDRSTCPPSEVRHPAVFGPLGRSRPLAVHELAFARTLTDRPVKVALPGPYLLTRTMWMECISDRAYRSRERPGRGHRARAARGDPLPARGRARRSSSSTSPCSPRSSSRAPKSTPELHVRRPEREGRRRRRSSPSPRA